MSRKPIVFLDLVGPHQELQEQLVASFVEAINLGHFVGGEAVERFEKNFASFTGSSYCVGVASGTDALRFSLLAANITQGSLVVTAPNTFIATTEAISQAGAFPAFVDVNQLTYNISVEALESFLRYECGQSAGRAETVHKRSGRIVSAILPVHLYGQPADMDRLQELAERFHLQLFEDACQAHGAEYYSSRLGAWRKAGSMGVTGSFSFYPGKNLGALGEGGAVTTNDKAIADRIRMLRDHGSSKKYFHAVEGFNGRLDAIQSGFLDIKLRRLGEWNELRRACAREYNRLFSQTLEVATPFEPDWARQNYHLYVIQVSHRDELQKHLGEQEIGTGLHYPLPLHLQEAYRGLGYKTGDFPVAERMAKQILSLPMYPGLSKSDQSIVASEIISFFKRTESLQLEMAK